MNEISAPPPLLGALLVGGASRRFGRPKALAELAGRTFAERLAAALSEVTGEVLLLGEGPVPASLAGLPRVADAPGQGGPVAGLLGALATCPGRALLVTACDQPLLDAAALRWLVAQRRPGALALVARLDPERIEPFPGIYEPASRPLLAALARAGGSLQPLGRRPDVRVADVPPELCAAWTSIDDEATLARLVAGSALPPC
jgi:molybdenum cofactor guanylyltransferase